MWKLLVLLSALLLSGCFGAPKATGNDRGGMVDLFGSNEQEAFRSATAHCARYGKAPRINQVQQGPGAQFLFDCT